MTKRPMKPKKGIGLKISGDQSSQTVKLEQKDALEKIFGTDLPFMAEALFGHCLKVLNPREASDDYPANDERAFMVGAVADIKPRDMVERMLAIQMAATHVAMVRSARWLANAETIDQLNAHSNGYTKLTRAYTAQMEALRKHRNGGKQTVTVQHVNVGDGGQALVGNVATGGRAKDEK